MRRRIIGVFEAHPRWMGFYTIRFYGRIRSRRSLAPYCGALAGMIERGEMLMSFDRDHGFWRYLWIGRQSSPAGEGVRLG